MSSQDHTKSPYLIGLASQRLLQVLDLRFQARLGRAERIYVGPVPLDLRLQRGQVAAHSAQILGQLCLDPGLPLRLDSGLVGSGGSFGSGGGSFGGGLALFGLLAKTLLLLFNDNNSELVHISDTTTKWAKLRFISVQKMKQKFGD